MNKCHTPIGWQNDTTPAINETNLNYMDGCIDTIDDRVVAMDTAKLEPSDVASVIKNITFNDTTGIFTFTRYNDSTFTLDTKLEKVVTNWSYDSSTQSLVLTLADGSTVNIPLSDFITETEFEDSATIGFTVLNHTVTAVVKANSIGDAQMQTGYLTDCQAAASTASSAASTSNTNQLISEGFANGTQGGVPVSSGSPYYENNAKYWKEQAQAIASSSLSGLSDVSITNPQDGQALVYDAANSEWVNGDTVSTKAARTDLTSIIATGSTNTTGAQIPNGAYFYLNGVFCRAIADIATNATFTKDTNYVETSVADWLNLGARNGKFSIVTVTDFDDMTVSGFYWCTFSSGDAQHIPCGYNGILMVFTSDGDGIVQMFIDRTVGNLYTRAYRNSWTAWSQK